MTTPSSRLEAPSPSESEDFYRRTRFWAAARSYGLAQLILTTGSGVAVLVGGAILFLYLSGHLGDEGLKALGVAYVSLAAALFGIVLAGLAVVAAFFDRQYVSALREAGTLDRALFGFWWVSAFAVLSLITSIAMTTALYSCAPRAAIAALATLATVLFIGALLDALSLVGTLMRHGLYRAELLSALEVEGGEEKPEGDAREQPPA